MRAYGKGEATPFWPRVLACDLARDYSEALTEGSRAGSLSSENFLLLLMVYR